MAAKIVTINGIDYRCNYVLDFNGRIGTIYILGHDYTVWTREFCGNKSVATTSEDLIFEAVALRDARTLPTYPAVYLVQSHADGDWDNGVNIYTESTCIYVGSAKNLRKRWEGHHRFIDFMHYDNACVWWMGCPVELLAEVERGLIATHKPILNGRINRDRVPMEYDYQEC